VCLSDGLVFLLIGDEDTLVEESGGETSSEGGEDVHPDVGPHSKHNGGSKSAGRVEGSSSVRSDGKDSRGQGQSNGKRTGGGERRRVNNAKDGEHKGEGRDELPEEDGHGVAGGEISEGGERVGVSQKSSRQSQPEEDSTEQGSNDLGQHISEIDANVKLVLESLRREETRGDGGVQMSSRNLGSAVDADGEGETVTQSSSHESSERIISGQGRVGSSSSTQERSNSCSHSSFSIISKEKRRNYGSYEENQN